MIEDVNNVDSIKEYLSELKLPKSRGHFCYYVGFFILYIFPSTSEGNTIFTGEERITHHEKLDISLYESKRGETDVYFALVDLEKDLRFINYQPIKYNKYVGLSSGIDIPIIHLCELIKYLHRLCNLTSFM